MFEELNTSAPLSLTGILIIIPLTEENVRATSDKHSSRSTATDDPSHKEKKRPGRIVGLECLIDAFTI